MLLFSHCLLYISYLLLSYFLDCSGGPPPSGPGAGPPGMPARGPPVSVFIVCILTFFFHFYISHLTN